MLPLCPGIIYAVLRLAHHLQVRDNKIMKYSFYLNKAAFIILQFLIFYWGYLIVGIKIQNTPNCNMSIISMVLICFFASVFLGYFVFIFEYKKKRVIEKTIIILLLLLLFLLIIWKLTYGRRVVYIQNHTPAPERAVNR